MTTFLLLVNMLVSLGTFGLIFTKFYIALAFGESQVPDSLHTLIHFGIVWVIASESRRYICNHEPKEGGE